MRKIIFIASCFLVIGLIVAIALFFNNGNGDSEKAEDQKVESQESKEKVFVPKDAHFNISEDIEIMSEKEFMQTMHEMTHQKVKANEKWGYTPMTPQQIEKMLMILDKADYKHEDFYREALTAWKNGDFSNAVKVHNTIWEWQGGTIGKAYGLMSPEEEREYLESQRKKGR